MRTAIVWCSLLAIGANGAALAQAPPGRQLNGPEIIALVTGKRISYLRYKAIAPESSLDKPRFIMREQPIRVVYFFRNDGSWTYKCTLLSTTGERECPRTPTGAGVWEVRGNTMCINAIHVRRDDAACYELYLVNPKRFYSKLVNGMPSSEDGMGDIE